MATPLTSRKRDLAYFCYFCMSIPIALLVDVQPIYVFFERPAWMKAIHKFHIDTLHDQNFINPSSSFMLVLWIELLFQVPCMLFSIRALYKDSPKVPLLILPLGVNIFVTTCGCIAEQLYWKMPYSQKQLLLSVYFPYALLSLFISVDMVMRLNSMINRLTALETQKKRR